MTDPSRGSWYLDRPLSGFALPRGRLGSLMGRLMGALNKGEQQEVAALASVQPGERVLEVGCGPGVLLELLLRSEVVVTGLDPSTEMCALAERRNREAVAAGRAQVRVGTAEDTGCHTAGFDAAVSVNNVPMWSDLDAGMRELARVVRPGGRVVVAWHGGSRPGMAARKLALADATLDRILASMRAAFGSGERYDGERIVAFRTVVSRAQGAPDAAR
jgi:ubiquinone/menaquinone biosynthesis C-methylase UbiE